MSPASRKLSSCAILLAATVLWMVCVTFCPTGAFAEVPQAHPVADGQSAHTHGTSHDHGTHPPDHGCGCESFKAFPAHAPAVAKAQMPTMTGFQYPVLLHEFAHDYAASVPVAQNTGPPGRILFAELVFQQCLLSHAPPPVV